MKENTKIIIACVITLILGTIINVTATTLLQANSISYKTSNGDTTDVNSALDRLFDVVDINGILGNIDISNIGDGTVTGAINELNSNLIELSNKLEGISNRIELVNGIPTSEKLKSANIVIAKVRYPNTSSYATITCFPDGLNNISNNDYNGTYKVANAVWNKTNGTLTATNGTITSTMLIY